MTTPRRTQAERRGRTQEAVLAAARDLFTAKGYAETAVAEIAERAAVSNGALYHLFPDKRSIMAALFEAIQQAVLMEVGTKIAAIADPFERLRAGCRSFLDAALDPTVQRIALVDARTALGDHLWGEIEARYGLGALQGGLAAIPGVTPEVARAGGHVLLGSLTEAALFVAQAEDQAAAHEAARRAIDLALEGYRPRT